jgi:hypothetical protein
MNKTAVALFKCHADAEPLQSRLSQNGIPAEIRPCAPPGSFRLEVPEDQFVRTHRLLMAWDASDGALRQTIRCPECRSLRIEYPQYSHKSIMPYLFVGFLTNIGATEKEYYCHDCHFTWPREGTKPAPARPHGAPYYFIDGVEQTTLSPEVRHQPV